MTNMSFAPIQTADHLASAAIYVDHTQRHMIVLPILTRNNTHVVQFGIGAKTCLYKIVTTHIIVACYN